MHVENSPDFKSVWQLSHNWINANPENTDISSISPELRIAIHRLMHAMTTREITARWKGLRIFMDDSFLSLIFDLYHDFKFYLCLRRNKFDKQYLDNLYAKRNEVITWCLDVVRLEPPSCWGTINLKNNQSNETNEENEKWHTQLSENRRKRIGCLELARKLWEEDSTLSYSQIYNHPTMQQYGNPSVFSPESFQKWAKNYAPESAKKGGRRKESTE